MLDPDSVPEDHLARMARALTCDVEREGENHG
jgi:hypothetical protein